MPAQRDERAKERSAFAARRHRPITAHSNRVLAAILVADHVSQVMSNTVARACRALRGMICQAEAVRNRAQTGFPET